MPVETLSDWYKPVNTDKRTDEHESDWQILGELELPDNVSTDDAARLWLTEILNNLDLSTEFFERFLKSAQASITRALGANGLTPFVYVHISILVPNKHNSVGRSWGYFQIERIGTKMNNVDIQEHAIDFYLYVEGD